MRLPPVAHHPHEVTHERRALIEESVEDDQQAGLGDRLANDLDNGVDLIREWPDTAPLHRGRQRVPRLRCTGTEVFPSGIVYFVHDDQIVVVAYAHQRRRPGYWRKRLKEL